MFYIYILQNKINHKIYVGQTNNLRKRFREHKAKDRLKRKTRLYSAIKKYGFENFEMIEIEQHELQSDLDNAEEFWIQYFQTRNREFGYNLATGGITNRGFKHTKEWKIKKSESMTHFYKNNKSNNLGENSPSSKLTNEIASKIRNIYINGNVSITELSIIYKISRSSIRDIIYNRSYKNDDYIVNNSLLENIKNKFFISKKRKF